MRIKSTVQKGVDLAFTRFAELLKAATFKKILDGRKILVDNPARLYGF